MTIEVLEIPSSIRTSRAVKNTAANIRKLPVKRSLFGPVDTEESMKFIERELKSVVDSSSNRWNFNFQTEEPIDDVDAKYEWIKISTNESVPSAYALNRCPYLCNNSQSIAAVNGTGTSTAGLATALIHQSDATAVVGTLSPTKTAQSLPHMDNENNHKEVESRLRDRDSEKRVTSMPPSLVQTSIRGEYKLSIYHKYAKLDILSLFSFERLCLRVRACCDDEKRTDSNTNCCKVILKNGEFF